MLKNVTISLKSDDPGWNLLENM